MLLPVPGSALAARFAGPYVIKSKLSDTYYIIHTLERRRKTRLCHVNMLKPYLCRADKTEANNLPKCKFQAERVSMLSHTIASEDGDDGLTMSTELLNGGCLKNS